MDNPATFPTSTLAALTRVPAGTIKRLAATGQLKPTVPGDPTMPARWSLSTAFALRVWTIMRNCKSPRNESDAALRYLSQRTATEIDAAHENGSPALFMVGDRIWKLTHEVPTREELMKQLEGEMARVGGARGVMSIGMTTWGDTWSDLRRTLAELPASSTE